MTPIKENGLLTDFFRQKTGPQALRQTLLTVLIQKPCMTTNLPFTCFLSSIQSSNKNSRNHFFKFYFSNFSTSFSSSWAGRNAHSRTLYRNRKSDHRADFWVSNLIKLLKYLKIFFQNHRHPNEAGTIRAARDHPKNCFLVTFSRFTSIVVTCKFFVIFSIFSSILEASVGNDLLDHPGDDFFKNIFKLTMFR